MGLETFGRYEWHGQETTPQREKMLVRSYAAKFQSITKGCDLTSEEQKQLEAAKALSEWCRWIITVGLALGAAGLGAKTFNWLDGTENTVWAGVVCLGTTVVIASFLLGSIPAAIQGIPHASVGSCNGIYAYETLSGIRLKFVAAAMHVFFILGIVSAVVLIAILLLSQSSGPPDDVEKGSGDAPVIDSEGVLEQGSPPSTN